MNCCRLIRKTEKKHVSIIIHWCTLTSVLRLVIIVTTFRPLYPPAFFRCLLCNVMTASNHLIPSYLTLLSSDAIYLFLASLPRKGKSRKLSVNTRFFSVSQLVTSRVIRNDVNFGVKQNHLQPPTEWGEGLWFVKNRSFLNRHEKYNFTFSCFGDRSRVKL